MAALIRSRLPNRPAAFLRGFAMLTMAGTLTLAGCSRQVEKEEDIRPVRAMRVAAADVDAATEFPGEVRARVESRLGFRVGGKIVARHVDVGAVVRRGQVLMQLDPQDLQLAQSQAEAGLRAAQSNLELASAELKRYQDLREKNFVSQAVLDAKDTAFKAAQASYEQALAAYRSQSNQAGYTNLLSDVDGVVTGIDAEAGQVVAAGTPVVRVAKAGEKEVVIGIPEDKVDYFRNLKDVQVRTWARPDEVIPGKLRELSPVADPATRTYAAKIAIPQAGEHIKLGMTAYVTFRAHGTASAIRLPLTALMADGNGSAVWVVENGAVRKVPVTVAGTSGTGVLISAGLAPGQAVVTAGVNLLKDGQKVRILGDDAPVAQAGAPKGAAK